ncbi:11445_t:CDS:2 [Funneliformis mosseae]|uniref:11445_t:CDS:1 n=1 Tax=Funneliformis mosseae TaxID=27381 RepID=A0A9N9AU49_FUNMO|nr:11445_t:CDS:2 [Funneliformis mosseae]
MKVAKKEEAGKQNNIEQISYNDDIEEPSTSSKDQSKGKMLGFAKLIIPDDFDDTIYQMNQKFQKNNPSKQPTKKEKDHKLAVVNSSLFTKLKIIPKNHIKIINNNITALLQMADSEDSDDDNKPIDHQYQNYGG